MNIASLLHSHYKKDDLEQVLQLLEQYAVEQKDNKLLTIVHTQQARMATLKKRYQIEGAHTELNVERNQLRAAIQENFATIDESYMLTGNVIIQKMQNSLGYANNGYKSYKWLFWAVVLLVIGLYTSWRLVHQENKLEANSINEPMVESTQLVETNAKMPSPAGNIIAKNLLPLGKTSSSTSEKITKSTQIALRFQSDQVGTDDTYRASINSVLLNQNVGTVVLKEGATYGHLIDCQLFTKEQPTISGINEDAIQYTITLKINVVNDIDKQCYSKVFQSQPLVGYADANKGIILEKAFNDVLKQFSTTPITFCN